MRPDTRVNITRTQGDTDGLSVVLNVIEDTGRTVVPDTATVELHIGTVTPTTVAGAAKGDDSGTFIFPGSSLSALLGTFGFEIEVTDGSEQYTIAKGKIFFAPQIA